MNSMLPSLFATVGLLGATAPAPRPATLLDLAGARYQAGRLSEAVVLIIDAQSEYVDGALPLSNMGPAVDEAGRVLARARAAGTPVIHIMHVGRKGGLFDSEGPKGQEIASLAPAPGEAIVKKRLPNSFAGTTLSGLLAKTGRKHLILVGYMTHMCVSTTARAALDEGYRCTIVAKACATRDLAGPDGSIIPAAVIHSSELAALADRFACIIQDAEALPE